MARVWNYYKSAFWSTRWWFVASITLFALGLPLGMAVYLLDPDQINQLLIAFMHRHDYEGIWAVLDIFLSNLLIALLSMFGGIFFGFAPMFTSVVNGCAVGIVFALLIFRATGTLLSKAVFFATALGPHGILELPLLLLAMALGLRLGLAWLPGDLRETRVQRWWRALRDAGCYVPILFVGLLVAACIEVYVTDGIMSLTLKYFPVSMDLGK